MFKVNTSNTFKKNQTPEDTYNIHNILRLCPFDSPGCSLRPALCCDESFPLNQSAAPHPDPQTS